MATEPISILRGFPTDIEFTFEESIDLTGVAVYCTAKTLQNARADNDDYLFSKRQTTHVGQTTTISLTAEDTDWPDGTYTFDLLGVDISTGLKVFQSLPGQLTIGYRVTNEIDEDDSE